MGRDGGGLKLDNILQYERLFLMLARSSRKFRLRAAPMYNPLAGNDGFGDDRP